jgi:hypothetical protein
VGNIERWERIATAWDRDGYPRNTRALTGGLPVGDGETEYVRADLHAGAVEALKVAVGCEHPETCGGPTGQALCLVCIAWRRDHPGGQ